MPTLISSSKSKIFTDYNDKIYTSNAKVYISFICFSSVKRFNSLVLYITTLAEVMFVTLLWFSPFHHKCHKLKTVHSWKAPQVRMTYKAFSFVKNSRVAAQLTFKILMTFHTTNKLLSLTF